MKAKIFLFLSFIFIASNSFSQSGGSSDSAYRAEVYLWHKNREKSLKSETGWLNVVGLHWLKEGENTFGSEKENNIVFPPGKADKKLGLFFLKDGIVSLKAASGVVIQVEGKPFAEGVVFDEALDKTLVLNHKSLRWFIIKRGSRYAVRLRDLESDGLKRFTHIEQFPVDLNWRVTATYDMPSEPKTIAVNDIIGLTTPTPFGGTLHFEKDGKKFQLDATLEGEDLFIVFADETTGNETYGGGRFLYTKKPVSGNSVILDFNKAYNPPCCFTDFATCPLPLPQNRLPVKVTAGEKSYGHH